MLCAETLSLIFRKKAPGAGGDPIRISPVTILPDGMPCTAGSIMDSEKTVTRGRGGHQHPPATLSLYGTDCAIFKPFWRVGSPVRHWQGGRPHQRFLIVEVKGKPCRNETTGKDVRTPLSWCVQAFWIGEMNTEGTPGVFFYGLTLRNAGMRGIPERGERKYEDVFCYSLDLENPGQTDLLMADDRRPDISGASMVPAKVFPGKARPTVSTPRTPGARIGLP